MKGPKYIETNLCQILDRQNLYHIHQSRLLKIKEKRNEVSFRSKMIANAIEDNKIRNLRQSALLECQKKCDRNIKNNNLKILEKIGQIHISKGQYSQEKLKSDRSFTKIRRNKTQTNQSYMVSSPSKLSFAKFENDYIKYQIWIYMIIRNQLFKKQISGMQSLERVRRIVTTIQQKKPQLYSQERKISKSLVRIQ